MDRLKLTLRQGIILNDEVKTELGLLRIENLTNTSRW